MAPRELTFVSGNKDKLSVVEAILGHTVNIHSRSLDLVEIQGTIDEITADICRRAADSVCLLISWSFDTVNDVL